MKTAVIYFSKTGNSKKFAESVGAALETKAVDIKSKPVLNEVDLLFIVGGIYGGESSPDLKAFVEDVLLSTLNLNKLIKKSMGSGLEEVMKKINSIWFGSKIVGLGLLILLVSFIFYIIYSITGEGIIKWLYKFSFIVSLIVFGAMGTILLIEFCQDKKVNNYFHANRATRIMISNSIYECQNCGNQNVKLSDKNCNICGIRFKENTKMK